MRLYHLPIILSSLMLAAACSHEKLPETAGQSSAVIMDYGGEPVPGLLHIMVSESMAEELETASSEGGTVCLPEVKSIAGSTVCIRSMKRLFPHAGKFEARTRDEGLHRWYIVEYDETIPTRSAASELIIPGVEIIEIPGKIERIGNQEIIPVTASDTPATASMVFDDPMLKDQWHYFNDGQAHSSVSGCDINVVPVWENYTTGREDIIVAVVDEGVDYVHEDLKDNMWLNPEESGDKRYGFNFVNNTPKVVPGDHGTHVAGTISAVNNNGTGVSGIAGGDYAKGIKGVKIMSCQIFKDKESGNEAAAIKWGADHGAVISQNSWGYPDATSTPQSVKAAVDYFIKYAGVDENGNQTGPMIGGVVFFAAGNEGRNVGYPAEYEKAIAVTATGADYKRAYYSNYGEWADIAAPGGDAKKGNYVLSTTVGNKYGKMQGTSMACPHVSGIAALILSRFGGPGFTAEALKEKLLARTTDISSFNRSHYMGVGLVNTYLSIAGSGGAAPSAPSGLKASASSNNIEISITIPEDEDDGKPYTIIVYYGKEEIEDPDNSMFAIIYTGDAKAGDTITGHITGLDFNSEYHLKAAARDLAGNSSGLSETVKVTTGSNNPPELESLDQTELTLKPHETGAASFSCTDPDGHFYTIELDPGSEAAVLDTLQRDKPIVRIKGTDANTGKYLARLTVADIYGATTVQEISYEILENHEPQTAKMFEDLVLSSKSSGTIVLKADEYFKDEDGEQLSYGIEISNTSVLNVTYAKGNFNITPMNYGYSEVTVTATDVRGKSVSQGFRVLVRDGNSEVDMYPNPTPDWLYVRTSSDVEAEYEIISSTGKAVIDGKAAISAFEPLKIDMSPLAPGVYRACIKTGGKEYIQNIVKL